MLPKEPFWMVYGVGQGAPTARHATPTIARDEAKRLARANPDITFVVLEAIGAVVKREFGTVFFRAPERRPTDNKIPF